MQPPNNDDEEMRLIEALIEDSEFQKLEQALAEPTLFDVLGITFEERTHSRMLAWLLDPSGSHGLGVTFVRRFLYTAAKEARSKSIDYGGHGRLITPLQAETASFQDIDLDAEYWLPNDRRLDLILRSDHEGWMCLIENKILAGEGEEQTTDYYEGSLNSFPVSRFPSRLLVYLSPEGGQPSSRHFVPMAYAALKGLLLDCLALASNFGRIAIDQYMNCFEGRIVEQKQLRDVCWKLYRNHQRAIDKIMEYGRTNRLGTKVRDTVLEELRTNGQTVIPERHVDWISKPDKPSGWGAGIWPSHWPTKPGSWVLYYGVWFEETRGTAEKIRIGIGAEGDVGRKLIQRFRELAGQSADELLRPVSVVSRNLEDLERAVGEGKEVLLTRIKESFHFLDDALRGDEPET